MAARKVELPLLDGTDLVGWITWVELNLKCSAAYIEGSEGQADKTQHERVHHPLV